MREPMRSALFVPATRPERFLKALGAGADVVIIDLEDAVERASKDQARRNMTEFAQGNPDVSFLVRVNDATTPWFESDLAVCGGFANIVGLLLPKAESADQIRRAFKAGKPVFPIVESAKGVLALDSIAASDGVDRLSFGSLDLMLDLGMTPDTAGAELLLNQVRCQILLHSKVCGLAAPLDGVYPNFSDQAGLEGIARQVCDMGFGGMLCIHPSQISTIHKAFAPGAADIEWARRVLDAAEAAHSSAFKMDGKMIDVPVIERARRIVEKSAL